MQYLTQHTEWVKVPFLETIQRVICRTTNRIFVEVPLCPLIIFWFFYSVGRLYSLFSGRDREYQNLNLAFAGRVVKFAAILTSFPKPLKPCVVPLYTCFFFNKTPR
jgi:hypothetical protein